VWDDFAQDSLTLTRAACAEKVTPIQSSRDCAGCALRKTVDSQQSSVDRQIAAAPRVVRRAPVPAPMVQPVAQVAQTQPVAVVGDARSNIVAQKIIQLQEWLAKQNRAQLAEEEDVTPIAYAQRPRARVVGEEKRVGWTD
jgi:hypothetical protein